jgi:glycosyltransferase involved in cell wall biosynthesis
MASPHISIVVPVFNEAENIRPLYDLVEAAMSRSVYTWEIVFVDDGSTDETYAALERLRSRSGSLKVIRFRRNFGQTAAMAAGIDHASGEIIVTMDGDLQNDPADIPMLVRKLEEGYDVVCGWRKERKDKLISRRIPSVVANWLIGRVTGVRIHDNGCSLKACRAATIKNVVLYGELHRFIPAMATLRGARIAELVVTHHPRRFGKSKYGIGRVWRVALDIVTVKMLSGFSSQPALWFGLLSMPCVLLGLTALFAAIGFYHNDLFHDWFVLFTVSFLLLFLAGHLLGVGMIGELLMRTKDSISRRRLHSVSLSEV